MTIRRAGIAGLGLIGGSIAAALRTHDIEVRAYDPNADHLQTGLDNGLIDVACATAGEVAQDADVVVLAAPVGAIVRLLPEIDRVSPPHSLIVDTGSVKLPVVRATEGLAGRARVVGGHPVAGKETAGPRSADAHLLQGHPFVLTPTAHTDEGAIRRARSVVDLLGARAVIMTPEQHDAVLARTSHLPQLLATALALTVEPDDLPLIGPGFRDMTRLAWSDSTMWRDILFSNEANVTGAVHRFVDRLNGLVATIERRDDDALRHLMDRGREVVTLAEPGGAV